MKLMNEISEIVGKIIIKFISVLQNTLLLYFSLIFLFFHSIRLILFQIEMGNSPNQQ